MLEEGLGVGGRGEGEEINRKQIQLLSFLADNITSKKIHTTRSDFSSVCLPYSSNKSTRYLNYSHVFFPSFPCHQEGISFCTPFTTLLSFRSWIQDNLPCCLDSLDVQSVNAQCTMFSYFFQLIQILKQFVLKISRLLQSCHFVFLIPP